MGETSTTVSPISVPNSGRSLPKPSSALGFLLLAIACWLFAATLGILVLTNVAVMANSDLAIDTPLQHLGVENSFLGGWATLWQSLGGPLISTIFAFAVGIALLVARRFGWAGFFIACAVGGLIIAEVIKRTVGRPRPTWSDALLTEVGGSFPSGHTMVGIYVYATAGLVAMYIFRRPLGTWIGWILIAFGVSLGPSRLILGVHWPSDVVAAWMLALGWVLIISAVSLALVYRRRGGGTSLSDEPSNSSA